MLEGLYECYEDRMLPIGHNYQFDHEVHWFDHNMNTIFLKIFRCTRCKEWENPMQTHEKKVV